MNEFNGSPSTDDMFNKVCPMPHNLWIYSQFTCPWENTLLTLVVSPSDTNIEAYVEMVDLKGDKKRTREEDDAMAYLPNGEKHLWTDLSDGLKHRSFDGTFMNGKLPNSGVKLCGCIENAIEIVPASSRVVRHLYEKHGPNTLGTYK
jgi:hypothetical protein